MKSQIGIIFLLKKIWDKKHLAVTIFFLLFYLFIVLKSAWISDDAYITFRTADNFVNGHGLTWNIGERVQVFTHPLWMFLITFFYFFTGEVYYTTIIISMIISSITVLFLAFKVSPSKESTWMGILLLIFSKAFIDYSTSGLENPLSYLLILLFLFIYLRPMINLKNLFFLSFIGSLAGLNRIDLLLLILPPLIFYLFDLYRLKGWNRLKLKGIYVCLIGFLPLIFWELFSLFYYGFLFPNTYYAKLNTTFSTWELVNKGFNYFTNSTSWDPVTLVVILFTVLVPFILKKELKKKFVVMGIVLYLVYILKIGGDFMSGRFFAVVFLVSIILLITMINFKKEVALSILLIVLCVLSLNSNRNPVLSGSRYNFPGFDHGIADERGYYYSQTGLLIPKRKCHLISPGISGPDSNPKSVIVLKAIGMKSFFANPRLKKIDVLGLGEPFLSKIPAEGRIGHFRRLLPAGYYETIMENKNLIKNKNLAKYYDKLSLIIKGKLFSLERLVEIVKMNLGFYDHLLREPYVLKEPIPLGEVSEIKKVRTHWDSLENIIYSKQIIIDLGKIYKCDMIELSLGNSDKNKIVYFKDNVKLKQQLIPGSSKFSRFLSICKLDIPLEVKKSGFDKIKIKSLSKLAILHSLGHIRLLKD
jgi:arabinofuranosyltransferase